MKKVIFTMAVAASFLAACSSGHEAEMADARANVAKVDAGMDRINSRNHMRSGGAQFSEGVYLGATPERSSASLLPARLQASGAVSLVSRDELSLGEIAQRLSEITNIPHNLALGPTGRITSTASSIPGVGDPQDSSSQPLAEQSPQAAASRSSTRSSVPRGRDQREESEVKMRPNLHGSLSEILDQVANTFDVEWSYVDGRIMLRDYVTRKYQISALPSASTASTAFSANSISSQTTMNSDIWAEVREAIDAMIGEEATVSIGSTTGLITVTAKVSDQGRVSEYVKQLNGSVSQQVSFNVNVLSVVLDEDSNFGLDLNAAFKSTDWNGGLNSVGGSVEGNGSVNIGLINGVYNINAIMQSLQSQGSVSIKTRAATTTANNRVAPIQVIDKTAYLKDIEVSEDSNGNRDVERNVEEIETGFQMQIFPRILNNQNIMVQFTVHLSELNDIKTFGDGNSAVQLPEVSTTSFEQQAVLENGQTLVLAGFERDRVEIKQGKSNRGIFGGGVSNQKTKNRVATIMLITPNIIRNK